MNIRNKGLAILISLILGSSFTIQADTLLGADLEIGTWFPDYDAGSVSDSVEGKSNSIFASATIEHPVPLLPNIKVSLSKVDSSVYGYTKIDYSGYYEILDNDLVSIDVGLGVSQFQDGHYLNLSFSEMLPHLYVDAEISLPFSNTTAYTDIHYLSYDGNSLTDAIVGLRYDFNLIAADIGVKAGYRMQQVDVEDFDHLSFDIKTDGAFVGLQADF